MVFRWDCYASKKMWVGPTGPVILELSFILFCDNLRVNLDLWRLENDECAAIRLPKQVPNYKVEKMKLKSVQAGAAT